MRRIVIELTDKDIEEEGYEILVNYDGQLQARIAQEDNSIYLKYNGVSGVSTEIELDDEGELISYVRSS